MKADPARLGRLITGVGEAVRSAAEPVPHTLLDELVATAVAPFGDPPGRFVVVVGEERDRLIEGVAEALGRHWGLGGIRPRGLASEGVLRAPALVLALSTSPASEGLDGIARVAFGVQNLVLLCAAHGLATHRTFGPSLVPEAVLDFVASHLGEAYRQGELVTMLAVGWPEGETAPVTGDVPAPL